MMYTSSSSSNELVYRNYYNKLYNNNRVNSEVIIDKRNDFEKNDINSYFNKKYTLGKKNYSNIDCLNRFKNNSKFIYRNGKYNLYNSCASQYNKNYSNFDKENINFNNNLQDKIKLTYQYKNISPTEISDKTNELINLQSKMCTLNELDSIQISDDKRPKSVQRSLPNNQNRYIQKKNPIKYDKKMLLKTGNIKKTKNLSKTKTYKKFSRSMNNKKLELDNINISFNIKKIWKDKYYKCLDKIHDIKMKLYEINKENNILEKRIIDLKAKEENKDNIISESERYENYNFKLKEKYGISEEIRKKQINFILELQNEVNNMREQIDIFNRYT